ncbi:glycerol kinase [Sinorhizobium medicae]|nr:glycerol kinase [Sinorhizobium medicae]
MTTAILAIDQGTTNSKAVLVSTTGEILSRGASPVGIEHPQPGWVEQNPLRIWESVQEAIAACLQKGPRSDILGIAISNQRESVTAWDAATGKPLGPVVSWQCRRSAPACAELSAAGHAERVRALTGLPIDPMFPGPKMKWLLDRIPPGHEVRLGTIDAWLIHCFTAGAIHACDAGNAARSQLYDLNRRAWSDELCDLFGVPKSALPEVCDSAARFGVTKNVPGLKDGIPIAWSIAGRPTYAFEGNILVSAAALPWMAEMLGLSHVEDLIDLAATAEPRGPGFVPAFVGLGAPYWHADARALFSGITFNTTRAQMARAVTDSMAFQVHDVFKAMSAQSPTPLGRLYADGGPSKNTFLMQCVADTLNHVITQCDAPEASALGAAYLAGLSLGVWPDLAAVASLPRAGKPVLPRPCDAADRLMVWQDAIYRSTVPGPSIMSE